MGKRSLPMCSLAEARMGKSRRAGTHATPQAPLEPPLAGGVAGGVPIE
jgi:hypothetical protein